MACGELFFICIRLSVDGGSLKRGASPLFQIAFKLRLIRWSFEPLASLLARCRSLRICASLASRQRFKIRRALVST